MSSKKVIILKKIWKLKIFHLLTIGVWVSLWLNPVLAQSTVERGEIYRIRNQVELNRQNQPAWNAAKLGEAIVPQDAVRTGANSRADLLFNEGTLVRTGAGTIFRFLPGRRSFELTRGAALIMIRPGQGESIINTPEARIFSQGTALFVQHDVNRNASLIGVLTNSLAGPVRVSNVNGEVTIDLQAGQFVSIINGVVGLVENFLLPVFYESIELAAGLGTGQENFIAQESPEVQQTINLVRAEALQPLANQMAWLNGFCRFNFNPEDLSPLLQWLGLGIPGERIILQLPDTDLFVTPMRSLTGISWLGNYCQTQQQPRQQ
jgi:hypothetical protein